MTSPLATELKTYKGQNRVLLVFAPSVKDKGYVEQKRLLAAAEDGLRERDMVVLELLGGEHAEALRSDLKVSNDLFVVVLIGKDGGEKERFLEPVEPTQLFSLIDRMPMRRREMQERG